MAALTNVNDDYFYENDFDELDFDGFLEDIQPTINEVGCAESPAECTICKEKVFTSAITCNGDSCGGNSWFHLCCVGLQENHAGDEWLCPHCCSESETSNNSSRPSIPTVAAAESTDSITGKRKRDGDCDQDQSKKKKVPTRRPQPVDKYTVSDVLENVLLYVIQILASLKTHHIYSRKEFPNTKPFQDATSSLSQSGQHLSFVNFWTWVGEEMWAVVTSADKRILGTQAYDTVLSKFHGFRVAEIRKRWNELLCELNIVTPSLISNVLLQCLLRTLLEKIFKERNERDMPGEEDANKTPLTTHDHQVINYISGFIPYALIKKFKNHKSPTAASFVTLLRSWKLNDSDADSFIEYVKEWLKKQSRGYLFQPNWDLHVFFRTLEYVGRKFLSVSNIQKYRDANLNELLLNEFQSNATIKRNWYGLVKDKLDGNDSQNLLVIMLKYWVKIRCTAYVKVYIDIRKANDNIISRKAEKGLRKQVDKN